VDTVAAVVVTQEVEGVVVDRVVELPMATRSSKITGRVETKVEEEVSDL